jgi:hypothetical protein
MADSKQHLVLHTQSGAIRVEAGLVLSEEMVEALEITMDELLRLRRERDVLGPDYYALLLRKGLVR